MYVWVVFFFALLLNSNFTHKHCDTAVEPVESDTVSSLIILKHFIRLELSLRLFLETSNGQGLFYKDVQICRNAYVVTFQQNACTVDDPQVITLNSIVSLCLFHKGDIL